MFQAIRRRVNATSTLAVIALVFALTGGAYAASRVLIKNIHQISPSVVRELRGKTGPAGPAGVGTPGPEGKEGKPGVGTPGAEGKEGKPGVGTPGAEGKEGKEGKEGPKGAQGSPWTAGGVLPSKSTETGSWSAQTFGPAVALGSISFNVPLEAPLDKEHVVFLGEEETSPHCPGTPPNPEAEAGYLCVYTESVTGELAPFNGGIKSAGAVQGASAGTGTSGALLMLKPPESAAAGEPASTYGTWAVTAP